MTTQNQLNSSDLPLAGGTMTGAINMGGFGITSLLDPVNPQDAVTKNYADNIISGGAAACVAASTANLTVTYSNGVSGVGATLTNAGTQATFALDGQSPTVGQRVLIKDQSTTFQNGIYLVTSTGSGATNWILTRATDYNTPDAINDIGVVPVTAGTVNQNTGWINTTIMVAVGTTAITFIKFSSLIALPVSLANGGTNASLTASNGGIVWSNATQLQILSGTATAQQLLLSGSSTTPQWSTTTYPLTNAINTLLYASSANVMSALATANSSVLVTSSGGIPSLSTTIPKGVATVGVTDGSSASAGNIGEIISSVIATGSAVTLASTTNAKDITSIALTAGDWDIWGNIFFSNSGTVTRYTAWSSNTTATQPDASLCNDLAASSGTLGTCGISIPFRQVNVSGNQTVYLSASANYSTGAVTGCGGLYARRVR